jgi:Uma2 family endonuclease
MAQRSKSMIISRDVELPRGVVLYGIDWATYEALRGNPENRRVRMTYNEGALELMMTPLDPHEDIRRCVLLMIIVWAEELGIPIRGKGSRTFKGVDQQHALEPDECYYIRREREVRGKRKLDLAVDPPPDLAVEVDITTHWLDKTGIYAKLGVPELWCADEQSLVMYELGADGEYSPISDSLNLPGFPAADFARWFESFRQLDETTWIKSWREWVRSRS